MAKRCRICAEGCLLELFELQGYCPRVRSEDVERIEASADLLFNIGDVDTAYKLWGEADRYRAAQRLFTAWSQAQAMGKAKEYMQLVQELGCPQCSSMEWTRNHYGVYVGKELKYKARRGEILPCAKKFLELGLQPPKKHCLVT